MAVPLRRRIVFATRETEGSQGQRRIRYAARAIYYGSDPLGFRYYDRTRDVEVTQRS